MLGKIPFLKFFLKKQLIWVPFLGIAWWALDFPFMRRYTQKFLDENPHLKGKDIETTRIACQKFKHKPVSVMNFVEGTRITTIKHEKQNSPFKNLLKPKAGGVAFVLNAMSEHLTKIVNVTIYYPDGIPTFMDFVSGKVNKVNVLVETMNIESSLIGDYTNDENYRRSFQTWLNGIWQNKDRKLLELAKQNNE
jgi:1-acyl-sn-glycerol-3-phosphate acyltransferase